MGRRASQPVVLVVDDEPSIRDLFRRVLEDSGYFVVEASTGERALEQLCGGLLPDAILLDLKMPGMGGLGFLLQIRADPHYGPIPVGIITGDMLMPHAVKTIAESLDVEVRFKPMVIDDILDLTQSLLASGSAADRHRSV